MAVSVKTLLLAAGFTLLPAVLLNSGTIAIGTTAGERAFPPVNLTYRIKDQSRALDTADDQTQATVRFAQTFGPSPMAPFMPVAPGAVPGFPHPMGPPSPPRVACEDGINQRAAIVGYLRSKLRLSPAQKDAWARVETAAEPVIAQERELCGGLPLEPTNPPSAMEHLAFAERHLSLRVALLRAVREPLHAFYDMLSAEQRAVLDRPPGPPRERL